MGEYNGYDEADMEREINNDKWYKDEFDSYMALKTYGDLNNSFKNYLWSFMYSCDTLKEFLEDGDKKEEFLWINNVISHYVSEDVIYNG